MGSGTPTKGESKKSSAGRVEPEPVDVAAAIEFLRDAFKARRHSSYSLERGFGAPLVVDPTN